MIEEWIKPLLIGVLVQSALWLVAPGADWDFVVRRVIAGVLLTMAIRLIVPQPAPKKE